MKSHPEIPLPGIKVNLSDIENELKQFWQGTAHEGKTTTIRASTMNLVILNRQDEKIDEIVRCIPEISAHHPGRVILAFSSPSISSEKITASVSAFCQLQDADKKQISCEQIALATGKSGEKYLPGTLLPVLLPDLPLYTYLSSDDLLMEETFYPFYEMTDRLILNSNDRVNSLDELEQRIDRIIQLRNKCKISDINWSLLKPWREALAQFFDDRDKIDLLNDILDVSIRYSGGGYCLSAYLLIAWLATRLKWRISKSDPQNQLYTFARDRTIQVKMTPSEPAQAVEGLRRVEINFRTTSKKPHFEAERNSGSMIRVNMAGIRSSVPIPALSHSSILCNELDFLYYDDVLMDSIKMISAMIKEGQNEVVYQY